MEWKALSGATKHRTSISTTLLPVTKVQKTPSRFSPLLYCPTLIINHRCSLVLKIQRDCVYLQRTTIFLCFQILNPVWSCQWGLMEALDRRIPIWLADGQVGYSCITMSCLQAQFKTLLKQYKVSVKLNHLDQWQGEIIIKKKFISGPCAFMLVCRN